MNTLQMLRPVLVMATVVFLGLPEFLALRRAKGQKVPVDHPAGVAA